jgi:porin
VTRGTGRRRFFFSLTILPALLISRPARADDPPPLVSGALRNTTDLWDDTTGGVRPGVAVLNKLQLSGTLAGDTVGLKGLSIHGQIFRTDGNSLSERVGDVQTVDSIDARPTTRLFEAWIEQKLGNEDHSIAMRAGLIDFNSDFDSIQTASLFVNSSHGIGADIARSGRNGPSIYPVSALAVRLSWLPSKKWTFRLAAFDGVPGDPERPGAFVAARLAPSDGEMLIGQVDYHLSDKAKVEAGMWHYTASVTAVDPSAIGKRRDQGGYVSFESPLPKSDHWSAWLRLGAADGDAQTVKNYLGTGIVAQGLMDSRPQDRIGFAIARAGISAAAQRAFGLSSAETSYEFTYQYKVGTTVAVQPDVQYVVHPSSAAAIPNALVVGMRLVLTAGFPRKTPAADATDPTVPPESPAPTDDGGTKPPS